MAMEDFLAEEEPQIVGSSSKVYDELVDYDELDGSFLRSLKEIIYNSNDKAVEEAGGARIKKLTEGDSQASTSMKPKISWLPNRDEKWTEEPVLDKGKEVYVNGWNHAPQTPLQAPPISHPFHSQDDAFSPARGTFDKGNDTPVIPLKPCNGKDENLLTTPSLNEVDSCLVPSPSTFGSGNDTYCSPATPANRGNEDLSSKPNPNKGSSGYIPRLPDAAVSSPMNFKTGTDTLVSASTTPGDVNDFVHSPSTLQAGHNVTGHPPQNLEAVISYDTKTARGFGLFARTPLPANHPVIVEEPMISCIYWRHRNGKRTVISEWAKLRPEGRLALRNTFWRLNTISTNKELGEHDAKKLESFIDDYGFWDGRKTYAHIFDLTCLINHACPTCANARHYVDADEPNIMTVRTSRKIRPGEELFIHYGKSDLPYGCGVCNAGAPPGLLSFLWPIAALRTLPAIARVKNWAFEQLKKRPRPGSLTPSTPGVHGKTSLQILGMDAAAPVVDDESDGSTLVPADNPNRVIPESIEVLIERERQIIEERRKQGTLCTVL